MVATNFDQMLNDAQGRLPNRPQGDGGSPLVAGLQVAAEVGGSIYQGVQQQLQENKTNDILGVLTQGDGVDPGTNGIAATEVADVRKAQLGVDQGLPGAVTKRTAVLIKRVKKLKADGRTELEIANAFRIAGISDPRLAGLEEASNALEREAEFNMNLKKSFVQGAGIAYQYDKNGEHVGVSGLPIDIDVSFAKAQKDSIEFDAATKAAQQDYLGSVDGAMNQIKGTIYDQLGPQMAKIDELNRSGRLDGEAVALIQADIRDTIANLEVRKGEFVAGIADKSNRDDAIARFDAMIAPYKEFVLGDGDPSLFTQLSNTLRISKVADEINFGRANPVLRELLNSNPELAKHIAQGIAFRTMERLGTPELSRAFGKYFDTLTAYANGGAETNDDGTPAGERDDAILFAAPEVAEIAEQELISTFSSTDPQAIENSTDNLIVDDVDIGRSKFEMDVRAALSPEATKGYSQERKREVFDAMWSNPKMLKSLEALSTKNPYIARNLGQRILEKVETDAILENKSLNEQNDYLKTWLIDVNPKTGNFEVKFLDKRTGGLTSNDDSSRGRISGRLNVGRTVAGDAQSRVKVLDKYVEGAMQYRQFSPITGPMNEADARKYYQEKIMSLGAEPQFVTSPEQAGEFGGNPAAAQPTEVADVNNLTEDQINKGFSTASGLTFVPSGGQSPAGK